MSSRELSPVYDGSTARILIPTSSQPLFYNLITVSRDMIQ